jgi:hypothetical protein
MSSLLLTVLRRLRLPLALAAFITLLAIAFAWPTSHVEPRDVPIALTGSPSFVVTTTRALDARAPGAFDITVAPTEAAGRAMLDDNEVDGLFEQTDRGSELVLGGAGRPAVAGLLTSVAGELQPRSGPGLVTDEVPPPSDDPHSAVFAAAALPTVLGAIAAGAILATSGRSRHDRLVSAATVAVLSGVGLTVVMNNWLGALGGDWWAVAGCYALGVGAIVAAINGLAHHFGRTGLVVAAATVMLLGNPLSGATSAPELLPSGWSALGQVLPPGALTNAMRGIAYYDDNGASSPVLILGAWFLVGSLLLLAGSTAQSGGRKIAATVTSGPSRPNPTTHEE